MKFNLKMSEDGKSLKYEIEHIKKRRTTTQGYTEYLIKWKDYGNDEMTWEPLDNLITDRAFDAIFEFENNEENQKNNPNRAKDVIDFLRAFKEFDSKSPFFCEITPQMRIGGFPLDKPKAILGIEQNKLTKEIYVTIEWEERESTGIKPMNTSVRSEIVMVFAPQLYLEYLERIIAVQVN